MPIEAPLRAQLRAQLKAQRAFRLACSATAALVIAYALAMPLAYLAPALAVALSATINKPVAVKHLLALLILVALCTGVGLALGPLLIHYPVSAMLVVTVALFLANSIVVSGGAKALVGLLLTMGVAMISAAAVASAVLAKVVVIALMGGTAIAVVCHSVACLVFPEHDLIVEPAAPDAASASATASDTRWLAVRATLILLPAYFMVLVNPALYMPLIMKSANLGQQASLVEARVAARELLLSTALAGVFAVVFWFALKLAPSLWFFGLWMLLFMLYLAGKLHGALASRFGATFWQAVAIQMLILLGPAVQDSANGNDVYQAFAIRFSLFMVVTLYAISAIWLLEYWRERRSERALALSAPIQLAGDA